MNPLIKEEKMRKGILVILSILFLAGNVFGQSGFQAVENDGKVTITGYTGTAKEVVIPETVNGMPIVAIGNEAFRGKGLNSITIPNNVTTIGTNAFADNNQLTSITIGANVTLVADSWNTSFGYGFDNVYNNNGKPAGAFKRGSSSESGYIWGMVSGDFLYVGATITGYTGSGGAVTIPSTINGTPVTAIEGLAFQRKRLTSVTIPNSVTTIGNNAFYENQLTSVTIGNSVTTIGNNAFSYTRLTSVTIGNSVTTIGDSAFSNNRLTNITIPNSVTSIGDYAFEDNQLTSITIGQNVQLGRYRALPDSFVQAYNGVAGTYTRPSTSSNTWTKGVFSF
jgi:hypothetical protein